MKVNQPKNFSYPKKILEKKIEVFLPSWCDKWIWLHYREAEDDAYCITLKNVYLYILLNDIRVKNYFIKTGFSNWKYATSTDKGFREHESSNRHQQAIQRLISMSTEEVFEMVKSNLTKVQSQNRVCLI